MTDTMIFLAVALVAAGLYIMHLHSIIGKYRRWSSEAQALLLSLSMKQAIEDYDRTEKAREEYGFDTEEEK